MLFNLEKCEIMANNVTPDLVTPPPTTSEYRAENTSDNAAQNVFQGRTSRPRLTAMQSSTSKDFEGATPKIGAILALRSENITKKANYDVFCEKLAIYVMNELKNGDAIVEVTKTHDADIIADFETHNKPKDLGSSVTSVVDQEIHKEEIKEYVKDLKQIRSNLKKIYSLVYGNCTESVQTMIKADSEFETKSKAFNYAWLFEKVKAIVSGLDTKVNLRVSLHDVIFNFMLLK